MTIATIQAFKQRAMKGLPKTDPKTGELINYDDDLHRRPRRDLEHPRVGRDLGVRAGRPRADPAGHPRRRPRTWRPPPARPLYSITPDAANGSAEGASLQRETLTFKVERGWTGGS
jgi:hypothetical protein